MIAVSSPRLRLLGSILVIAALVGSGVSGCRPTKSERRSALRGAARELLPPQARIRALGFGNCVELAGSPSCAAAVFELPERSSALRARAVRSEAVKHGWTVAKMDDAEGGWSLFLRRRNFTATVFLWRPNVYRLRCTGSHPDDRCFNTLSVQQSSA
jgi:hypothetical protein